MTKIAKASDISFAVAQENWEEAAAAILSMWQNNRAPELSELLNTLEDLVAQDGPPVEVLEDLDALAGVPRLSLGAYLKALYHRFYVEQAEKKEKGGMGDDAKNVSALLEVLESREADPRVSSFLLDLLEILPVKYTEVIECGEDVEGPLDDNDPFTAKVIQICIRHFSPEMDGAEILSEAAYASAPKAELSSKEHAILLKALLKLRASLFHVDEARSVLGKIGGDASQDEMLRTFAEWLRDREPERARTILKTLNGQSDEGLRHRVGFVERCFAPMRRFAVSNLEQGFASHLRFPGQNEIPKGLDWKGLEAGWLPGWAGVESMTNPPLALLRHGRWERLRFLECPRDVLDAVLLDKLKFPALTHLSLVAKKGDKSVESLEGRLLGRAMPSLQDLRFRRPTTAEELKPWLLNPGPISTVRVTQPSKEAWAHVVSWLSLLRENSVALKRVILHSSSGERWVLEHEGRDINWQKARLEVSKLGSFRSFILQNIQKVSDFGVLSLELATKTSLSEVEKDALNEQCPSCATLVQPELPSINWWPGNMR